MRIILTFLKKCQFFDTYITFIPHSHLQKESLSSAKSDKMPLGLHPQRKLAQLAHLRAKPRPPKTSRAQPAHRAPAPRKVHHSPLHTDHFFTWITCFNFSNSSFQLPRHRSLQTRSGRARPNPNPNPNNRKLNHKPRSRSRSTGSWRGWCLSSAASKTLSEGS